MRRALIGVIVLKVSLVFLIVGARGAWFGSGSHQPPHIRYGQDMCDWCGMIISDPRFAAAYITDRGEVRRFNDIGEMLVYERNHQDTISEYWVHDYESREWLLAEEAYFVVSRDIHTPMEHGIVAFQQRTSAQRMANEHGVDSLSFVALRSP